MKNPSTMFFTVLLFLAVSARAQDESTIYRMPVMELKQMVLDMSELIHLRQRDSLSQIEINTLKADITDCNDQLSSLKQILTIKDKEINVLEDSKPGFWDYFMWGGTGAAVGLVVGYAVGHAAGG